MQKNLRNQKLGRFLLQVIRNMGTSQYSGELHSFPTWQALCLVKVKTMTNFAIRVTGYSS